MTRVQKTILVIIISVILLIVIIKLLTGKKEEPSKEETNNVVQNGYVIEYENGDKLNTSEALKEPRNELEYYISNITLEETDGQTIFKLEAENQGSTDIPGQLVDIIFIDENEQEKARLPVYIRAIKAGESIETQATIESDFTNVYNFKLEKRTG